MSFMFRTPERKTPVKPRGPLGWRLMRHERKTPVSRGPLGWRLMRHVKKIYKPKGPLQGIAQEVSKKTLLGS